MQLLKIRCLKQNNFQVNLNSLDGNDKYNDVQLRY